MTPVGSVVLVSGAGRYLGSVLAAALAAQPSVGRIVAIDTAEAPPRDLGRTEYLRADVAHPLIGKILDQADVGTVVHFGRAGGSAGLTSLLRACERARTVHRFVLVSTTAVYGADPRDPAVFTERTAPISDARGGRAREAVEAETFVRTLARHRPDIMVTLLRLAPVIGPNVDNWLTRYLRLPILPARFGFDPRLQFLHDSDAIEVLFRAVLDDHPGVVNVAADGVLTLSQVARRAGRPRLPVPSATARLLGIDPGWLTYGRVVDTNLLKTRLGYAPAYSTETALGSFLDTLRPAPRFGLAALDAVQRVVA